MQKVNVTEEIEEIDRIKGTKEMRSVEWPSKGQAIAQFFRILAGTGALMMLIAAGDEIGKQVIGMFL